MAKWLMKSEPDVYGIDDLAREGTNFWEGCRNYQVRNFMRDLMSPGDEAFFYHSNAQPSGIAGILRIVSPAEPDPTQFDPASEYHDPKSPADAPRWLGVHVQFVRKFDRVIPLCDLKAHPVLAEMQVCRRGQRLSILPVTEAEWEAVNALATSYEAGTP